MRSRKAQAAMEELLILGVVLLILLYLSYFVVYDTRDYIQETSAEDAVGSLVKAVNRVYARGPCNKEIVYIEVPGSAVSSSVTGGEVNLRIKVGDGFTDVNAMTLGNASGTLPTAAGTHELSVEYTCGGQLTINPQ